MKKWTEWRYLQGDHRYRIWMRLIIWFSSYVRRHSHRFFFFFFFFPVSGIFLEKPIVGFCMYSKPTKFDEIRWSHFWENRNLIIFRLWTTLNFRGRSKTKIQARYVWKRTLHIEFERDWSAGFFFQFQGFFPGKADSTTLLGLDCTINPQNLIKIVGAVFEKIKILNVFLMWTTLNFKVSLRSNILARGIYKRTLYIEFEQNWSFGLGPTLGDGKNGKFQGFFGKGR